MCLAIPGRIVETYVEHDVRMGKVDFGGVSKNVCLVLTPDADVGEYVIVHVGFSLHVIDEGEAQQVFAFLRHIDELNELRTDASESAAERLL
ncbi:MAG: HypC/HybG/HupF family hydrogenase formation chaperone [Planctomycetaceae bacterium]